MHSLLKLVFVAVLFAATTMVMAQGVEPEALSDEEALKVTMLEALMAAPGERALPIVGRVLAGDESDEVKSRALFVLSQIDLPEAQTILLRTAREGSGELRLEAIRMIGISGAEDALAGLGDLYHSGDLEVKERVLEAYLIAGDTEAVYDLAANAQNEEEFKIAVQTLGAMGATDELRRLREEGGHSETLIQAYSIAGDYESLMEMAKDSSQPQMQVSAIQSLGVIGGAEIDQLLMQIYREATEKYVKDAALHGMMISGYEDGVVELFRESEDPRDKRMMLQMLMAMDSDAALEVIDAALGDQ